MTDSLSSRKRSRHSPPSEKESTSATQDTLVQGTAGSCEHTLTNTAGLPVWALVCFHCDIFTIFKLNRIAKYHQDWLETASGFKKLLEIAQRHIGNKYQFNDGNKLIKIQNIQELGRFFSDYEFAYLKITLATHPYQMSEKKMNLAPLFKLECFEVIKYWIDRVT